MIWPHTPDHLRFFRSPNLLLYYKVVHRHTPKPSMATWAFVDINRYGHKLSTD